MPQTRKLFAFLRYVLTRISHGSQVVPFIDVIHQKGLKIAEILGVVVGLEHDQTLDFTYCQTLLSFPMHQPASRKGSGPEGLDCGFLRDGMGRAMQK